ncbi:MAG: hypothetical protein IT379_30320 [Deltaproteobacteria bacterium]|nr:hypothetical protein [Deltaproteobacteria bacterium]
MTPRHRSNGIADVFSIGDVHQAHPLSCHREADIIHKTLDLAEQAQRWLDTLPLDHADAYCETARLVLQDEDGNIRYARFDDERTPDRFASTLADRYLVAAERLMHMRAPTDVIARDLFLFGVVGMNSAVIREVVRRYHPYTLEQHLRVTMEVRGNPMERARVLLDGTIAANIRDEDVPALLRAIGADRFLDVHAVRREEVMPLLHDFLERGCVTRTAARQLPRRTWREDDR